MPLYVVTRVQDLLNDRERSLKGARVLVVGVSYKPNITDMRESPALPLIDLLRGKGAIVEYADPYVPDLHLADGVVLRSVELRDALASADCVIVVTAHDTIDFADVASRARLLFDTRNVVPAGEAVYRL